MSAGRSWKFVNHDPEENDLQTRRTGYLNKFSRCLKKTRSKLAIFNLAELFIGKFIFVNSVNRELIVEGNLFS